MISKHIPQYKTIVKFSVTFPKCLVNYILTE